MNTTKNTEAAARGILTELEERLATHDLDRITEFFTDDIVLIGDGTENFDRASTVGYLGLMADMEPTARWQWERVAVVLDEPNALGFTAAGTLGFDDPSGQPLGEPEPFRVTCLAVDHGGQWRLKHFHGSRPAA